MKKLSTVAILALTAIIIFLSSCGNKDTVSSEIKVKYVSQEHTFVCLQGMYIYQLSNYTIISGVESGTTNSITLTCQGIDTGTYLIGPAYHNSMALNIGSLNYSSIDTGAHGSIYISKLDHSTMKATGTFSGTLINGAAPHDSLPLTDGSISVKYQFQ